MAYIILLIKGSTIESEKHEWKMAYLSPKQCKIVHHCLKMAILCALCITSSGCMRFLDSALDGDAFLDINRPYFYSTREYITEIASPTDGKSSMTLFVLLDLPFTFAVDALVEVPWKALNDVMRPLHEWEKKKKSSNDQLFYPTIEINRTDSEERLQP